MILRRVIEHFRRQEWTAIGIDLVIVVVGVVIGIQVSNWNEQRAVDEQGASFTAHLRADLREEDWAYQLMIVYYGEVLRHAELTVDALDGTAPLEDEALLISAYRATQYKQRLRRRSTYDELISTGTIGLIRDRTLRDTAMRLFNSPSIDNLVREGAQSRFREAFRMTLPNAVQRALGRQCGDRIIQPGDYAISGVLDYPCTTGLSQPVIAEAAGALRFRPDLVPMLRLRVADLETRLNDLTRNNQGILENLRAIAKEKHRGLAQIKGPE